MSSFCPIRLGLPINASEYISNVTAVASVTPRRLKLKVILSRTEIRINRVHKSGDAQCQLLVVDACPKPTFFLFGCVFPSCLSILIYFKLDTPFLNRFPVDSPSWEINLQLSIYTRDRCINVSTIVEHKQW